MANTNYNSDMILDRLEGDLYGEGAGKDAAPSFKIIPNLFDTLSFDGELSPVIVNLTAGTGIPVLPIGALITDIHNLIGTALDDVLTGASLEVVGDVAISYIMGGEGADTIDGGTSLARASFANATGGVIASVDAGGIFGEAAGDTYVNIGGFIGSDFGDVFTGSNVFDAVDRISAGEGDDFVFATLGENDFYDLGGGDNDTLSFENITDDVVFQLGGVVTYGASTAITLGVENIIGGAGDDVLIGSVGNNILEGGAGDDTLDGAEGSDQAVYSTGALSDFDIIANIDGSFTVSSLLTGTDTLHNIESILFADGSQISLERTVTLSTDDDDYTTLTDSEIIFGRDGDDVVQGGDSNEELYGGVGDDTLSGGAGDDVVSGGVGNDTVNGGEGNDTTSGGAGNDVISGGAGDDMIDGGRGADTINGGEGFDIADYSDSFNRVNINMITQDNTSGEAQGDTLTSIECIIGSQFGDTIRGRNSGDHFIGNAGRDNLIGFGGDDILEGGDGRDFLSGGAGADVIDGGESLADMARYLGSDAGVTVNLAQGTGLGGHAEGDVLIDIEHLYGSSFDDTLIGNEGSNRFYGGDGVDTLLGEGGIDHLFGGDGRDVLMGGDSRDYLYGEAGNDFLNGGRGADVINGGEGRDMARYNDSDAGVQVDLAANTGRGGHAQNDKFFSIESVFGSSFNDSLTGDEGDNYLYGHHGDDILDGGEGVDRLYGGAGRDTFVFNTGDDVAVITDFEDDIDTLDLSGLGYSTLSDASSGMSQRGDNIIFDVGNGDAITILNMDIDSLANDIVI